MSNRQRDLPDQYGVKSKEHKEMHGKPSASVGHRPVQKFDDKANMRASLKVHRASKGK